MVSMFVCRFLIIIYMIAQALRQARHLLSGARVAVNITIASAVTRASHERRDGIAKM
jgi:hypothetical protein